MITKTILEGSEFVKSRAIEIAEKNLWCVPLRNMQEVEDVEYMLIHQRIPYVLQEIVTIAKIKRAIKKTIRYKIFVKKES